MNELYERLSRQLTELIAEEQDFIANCANTSALLKAELADLDWVGFYFAREGELVLGPFQGMPACTRIPWGQGVCGAAADIEDTIIVPDVHQFPGHIGGDAASRSEIVVPMLWQDAVLGVLDLDSAMLDRFQDEDREGLEHIVEILLGASDLWSAFGVSG
jgi:L-methionine (R)-S-oxide reductase